MAIIGESLTVSQTPHQREREFIDQTGTANMPIGKRTPCQQPVPDRRHNQTSRRIQPVSKINHILAERVPGGRIGALRQDERCGREFASPGDQALKGLFGIRVPLIVLVPNRQQSNRVEEHRAHG